MSKTIEKGTSICSWVIYFRVKVTAIGYYSVLWIDFNLYQAVSILHFITIWLQFKIIAAKLSNAEFVFFVSRWNDAYVLKWYAFFKATHKIQPTVWSFLFPCFNLFYFTLSEYFNRASDIRASFWTWIQNEFYLLKNLSPKLSHVILQRKRCGSSERVAELKLVVSGWSLFRILAGN